mgnify:CR=1 FL=1
MGRGFYIRRFSSDTWCLLGKAFPGTQVPQALVCDVIVVGDSICARKNFLGLDFRGGGLFVAGFEDGHEGFLWDVDRADALHALLAFFLLFEEFAFT